MGLTPPLNNVQKNYAFGAGGHPLANDDYDDFEWKKVFWDKNMKI